MRLNVKTQNVETARTGGNKKKRGTIMAIITCPECGQQLSGEEEYCPNCNRSVPRNIDSAKSKKEEYVAAGKLLQRVAVALLAVGYGLGKLVSAKGEL